MAINKNKIVAQAQKFTAKGQFEKAISEYQKLLKADPSDVRTWLKIGDLYMRMGARKEATQTYLRVAEQYTKNGFHLKAVAVFKQVLKLDPTLVEIHKYLAASYLELGLVSESLIQLEQLADIYQRTGRNELLLEILIKMGEIDPHNIATRLRIAELLSKEDRVAEAAEQFSIACDELKKQRRTDDFLKVAERLFYHDPSRIDIAREAAQAYVERGQYKKALGKLQACFVKEPKDLFTLELLANAFQGLEQPDKAISVYKEMAILLKGPENEDERKRILHEVLRLDPKDEMAQKELGGQPSRGTSAPAKGRDEDEFSQPDVLDYKIQDLSEEEIDQRSREVVSETLVLVKYGLKERALDHIQKVFEYDPYNIDAREMAKDLLLDLGKKDEALDQLFLLAEVFQDSQPEGSVYYLHEILKIDPTNVPAREMIVALGGIMPENLEQPEDPKETVERGVRPVDEDSELARLDLEDQGERQKSRPEPKPLRESAYEPTIDDIPYVPPDNVLTEEDLLGGDEDPIDLDVRFSEVEEPTWSEIPSVAVESKDGFTDVESDDESIVFEEDETPPDSPVSDVDAEDSVVEAVEAILGTTGSEFLEDETDYVVDEEVDELDELMEESDEPTSILPVPPKTAPLTLVDEAPKADAYLEEINIDEELDEIEFFLSQDLLEEAEGILDGLLENHAHDERVQGFVDQLNQAKKAQEDKESFFDPETIVEGLAEIETDEEPQVSDIQAILGHFKMGVQEMIPENDHTTHYDLGIAYKEMGLYEEAIAEFNIALGDPERVGLVKSMIGICHVALDRVTDAIEIFKDGLSYNALDENQKMGLLYELGKSYELIGKKGEALECFRKINAMDRTFADVSSRIANLQGEGVTPGSPSFFS